MLQHQPPRRKAESMATFYRCCFLLAFEKVVKIQENNPRTEKRETLGRGSYSRVVGPTHPLAVLLMLEWCSANKIFFFISKLPPVLRRRKLQLRQQSSSRDNQLVHTHANAHTPTQHPRDRKTTHDIDPPNSREVDHMEFDLKL